MGRSVRQSRHGAPWCTTTPTPHRQLPGAGLPFFAPRLEAASGSSSLSDPSRGALLLPGGWEDASICEALTLCRAGEYRGIRRMLRGQPGEELAEPGVKDGSGL